MRWVSSLFFALVLGLMGCSETGGTAGDGGSGGTAGEGGSGSMPACGFDEQCEDGNECTEDACTAGLCEYQLIADGTACDDGNECTVSTCSNGACNSTSVEDGTACDEANDCTVGMCIDGECDFTLRADDTECGDDAGTCQQGSCRVACTEQGILDAIASGGGPFTFDCDGPTTVMTKDTIVIDNDVVLDGGDELIIDGADSHSVLFVPDGVIVKLRALTITGGRGVEDSIGGAGIKNYGVLRLSRVSVEGNTCAGGRCVGVIFSSGGVTITDSAITGNTGMALVASDATLTNVTIAGNTASPLGGTIWSFGSVVLVNCTVSEIEAFVGGRDSEPPFLRGTLIEGDCGRTAVSGGYNIESPGDTCGFDQTGDQASVPDPMLGPLQDNGGPTETHALLSGSPAINRIPVEDCLDADGAPLATDQRGEPRPETGGTLCDVGAFERQPADP